MNGLSMKISGASHNRRPRGRRTPAAMVVSLCLLIAFPAAGHAQGASREVREAVAQVVTLRGYEADGRLTAQGSGFFFGPGRIATNYHVIRGASIVRVIGADGDTLASTTYAEAVDERLDLAILPAPEGKRSGLTIETFFPDIGDRVWTYGSPRGLTGTMSDGIVSAVRERNGRTVLQISAPISPGSSGGPVLDSKGRVVGVTVSSVRGGQNLNFAVPSRELARLAARRADRLHFPIGEPSRAVAGNGGESDAEGQPPAPRPEIPDRWQLISRTVSDAELYYDELSLDRDGDRRRVWVYAFYPETLMAGEAAFDSSKALFELRCDDLEFRLNQYLLLRGERVIGSSGSVSGGEWSAVAPESVAEVLVAEICTDDVAAGEDAQAEGEPDTDEVSDAESAGESAPAGESGSGE